MAIRDILICLDPTDAGENRLNLAASIACEQQARLAGAFLLSEQIPGARPYAGVGIASPAGVAGIPGGAPVIGGPVPAPPPASRAARCWRWAISMGCIAATRH